MKSLILLALSLQISTCFAGAAMPCEKMEYARLKDLDKKELVSEYCSAMSYSELNGKFKVGQQGLFEKMIALHSLSDAEEARQDMIKAGNAQVSCLAKAEDVSEMLKKKFKAKPPTCESQ